MREIQQDLWAVDCDWLCITTNGTVKRDGRAVMGRGCALEATKKLKDIDAVLGWGLGGNGNVVMRLGMIVNEHSEYHKFCNIYSFPVKHHWRDKADLDLIAQSCEQLLELYNDNINQGYADPLIAIPRPGCGAGGLSWRHEVRPLLEAYFKDSNNIIIVSKPGEV